jgi:hypothetical protein
MDPGIRTNTPPLPALSKTAAIKLAENIADSRLKEYTKPTARAHPPGPAGLSRTERPDVPALDAHAAAFGLWSRGGCSGAVERTASQRLQFEQGQLVRPAMVEPAPLLLQHAACCRNLAQSIVGDSGDRCEIAAFTFHTR